MKKIYILFLPLATLLMCCQKDFLEAKPDKSLAVPKTVKDLQALLDNANMMNNYTPFLGEVGSGDYDLQSDRWQNLQAKEKNAFVWAKDVFENQFSEDWDWSYRRIFYANQALQTLEKIKPVASHELAWKNVKGTALFFRGWTLFNLAQVFCKPYDKINSGKDHGLPLRLEPDINIPSARSTVTQTYQQILQDLKQSINYLPVTAGTKTRPSKHGAYALLATVYLQMEDYDQALLYADSSLKISDELLDYNTVNAGAKYPFLSGNKEIIFQSMMLYGNSFVDSYQDVNKQLYSSYAAADIRRSAFFNETKGVVNFKGSYYGAREFFSGLATDEIYLVISECHARKNNVQEALRYLNLLLQKRWKPNSFTAVNAASSDEAVSVILEERRKELVFRGRRWSDLRRLNKDSRYTTVLSRVVNGIEYTLLPNDPRYVLPIPSLVIQLTGMEQNPR